MHRMMLVTADFKEVKALVIARRKADVTDHSARPVSENTRANTSPSAPDSDEAA